VTAPRHIRSG